MGEHYKEYKEINTHKIDIIIRKQSTMWQKFVINYKKSWINMSVYCKQQILFTVSITIHKIYTSPLLNPNSMSTFQIVSYNF